MERRKRENWETVSRNIVEAVSRCVGMKRRKVDTLSAVGHEERLWEMMAES